MLPPISSLLCAISPSMQQDINERQPVQCVSEFEAWLGTLTQMNLCPHWHFQMTFLFFFISFFRAITRSNAMLSSHIFNALVQGPAVVKPMPPTLICVFSSGFWFALRGLHSDIMPPLCLGCTRDIVGHTCKLVINMCTKLLWADFDRPLHKRNEK